MHADVCACEWVRLSVGLDVFLCGMESCERDGLLRGAYVRACVSACACFIVCVRACISACVRAFMRVRAYVRVCVRA